MSNKRTLKKYVHDICDQLATELLIASSAFTGFDEKKVDEIVRNIASLQATTLAHATFAFDKSRRDYENAAQYNREKSRYNREAFNHLADDFQKGVAEIIKMMNEALPAQVRESFKEAAAE